MSAVKADVLPQGAAAAQRPLLVSVSGLPSDSWWEVLRT